MPTRNGVYYTDQGKGNVSLLFLHFYGGSSDTWKEVIEILSPTFRCVALDLYGFGRTKTPEVDINVSLQTELVLQMIVDLHLENIVLIGHSMGGKIALSVASRQPAGLKSVVLVAPSPPTPEPIEDRAALKKAFGDRTELEKLVKKLTVDPLTPEVFERVVKDHLAVSAEAWNGWIDTGSREDISADMKNVTLPVLVANGSNDPNFTIEFLQEEIGSNLKQTTFTEIANAGHLIPLEKAEELAELISNFAEKETN